MLAQLAQAGVVADPQDGDAPGARLNLLDRKGSEQVEVVADDDIRVEGVEGLAQALAVGALPCLEHGGREVAVARGGIGHLVGHAAEVEGQLGRVEDHGEGAHSGGQVDGVAVVDAAEHGLLDAAAAEGGHQLVEVDAASGAVRLLGDDVQDPHGSELPSLLAGTRTGRLWRRCVRIEHTRDVLRASQRL